MYIPLGSNYTKSSEVFTVFVWFPSSKICLRCSLVLHRFFCAGKSGRNRRLQHYNLLLPWHNTQNRMFSSLASLWLVWLAATVEKAGSLQIDDPTVILARCCRTLCCVDLGSRRWGKMHEKSPFHKRSA